jgi:tetratricopeptide (TPR) repeat protein
MGEAARKLSFSLQLDPTRYRSRCELAEILMALGKYRDALKHLLPIESDPRAGPELWTQMGIACDRLGKADEAVAYWERAADQHPLARRLLMGRLHEDFLLRFRGGDLEGARRAVERAREIDPDDRDGILDATCLFLAWEGEEDDELVALASADPSRVQPGKGWGGGEFGLHPEVRQGIPAVATRVCCGDGTRCDAVRSLVQRLVQKNGPQQAMEIQKSLLQEGCKVVAESLAAALEEREDGP